MKIPHHLLSTYIRTRQYEVTAEIVTLCGGGVGTLRAVAH